LTSTNDLFNQSQDRYNFSGFAAKPGGLWDSQILANVEQQVNSAASDPSNTMAPSVPATYDQHA
jgi:hypothetical protein